MKNKTAILIFTNSPEKDAQRKFGIPSKVFGELTQQTLQTVEKIGVPFFQITDKEQVGITFGERFTNAIQSVFEKGFENIIAIGNDTPHLSTKHLATALKRIENNELVLGPSKDGGFYLLGICKKDFNAPNFLKLPWNTHQLLREITQLAKSIHPKIHFLEFFQDLDSKNDILKILQYFSKFSKKVLTILFTLISVLKNINFAIFQTYQNIFLTFNFNKGSPVFLVAI